MWGFFANVANKDAAACHEVAKFAKRCYEKVCKKVKQVVAKAKPWIDEGIKKMKKRVSRIFSGVEGMLRILQLVLLICDCISAFVYILSFVLPPTPPFISYLVLTIIAAAAAVAVADEGTNALSMIWGLVLHVAKKVQAAWNGAAKFVQNWFDKMCKKFNGWIRRTKKQSYD